MPAPATVPRLKNAWKSVIRVRPKACSTEAASTLIITSVAPNFLASSKSLSVMPGGSQER